MPDLNWMVPCRRAVVLQPVSYQNASNAWQSSLEDAASRGKLTTWYEIDSGEYDAALHYLSQFIDRFFNQTEQPPQAEPRLDDPVRPCETSLDDEDLPIYDDFCVRLWKGPLRVLREADGSTAPPILNDFKQVVHRSTDFLPGDVLEFPLAMFLLYAAKTEFRSCRFNPNGSFLLGDAVSGSGAELHDNLLAMKFQLMLNLAVGAFYHTGSPQSVGFSENVDGEQIASRGMIYGGSFGNATQGARGGWRVATNQWGFGGPAAPPELSFPYNLPSDASMSGWQANHMLTAGWACVTSTLFLTNYMFNNQTDYGDGGVMLMIRRSAVHPLRQRFTEHPASDTNQSAVDAADMCVFCKSDHEYAVIKLFPAENLLQPDTLPSQGFISAYNPLNGSAQTSTTGGQLFLFEASGRLGRWRRTPMYSVFQPNRFIWEAVGSSTRTIFRPGLEAWYATPTTDASVSLGQDRTVTSTLRPIWIKGMAAPVVRNYLALYAERAVPYPTMGEARNKFPTISAVLPRITKARHAVWKATHGQIPGVQPNSTYQSLLPALEPEPEPSPVP
jgi:hypothetical protein